MIRLIEVVFSNSAMCNKQMHPRDQQINEITYSRSVAKCPWIY